MASQWRTTEWTEVHDVEMDLARLAGKRWLCRGHSLAYETLTPLIDRGALRDPPRAAKLERERQSIDLFRAMAQSFGPGEEAARLDEIIALAVLRHYGVPTRLLDWSESPHVAAYFAVCGHDDADGELWAFDRDQYAFMGKAQWERWPQTTTDGSGNPGKFDAKLTAFAVEDPLDWFCCMFYPTAFPRQSAQRGAYSLTARFGVDHASLIAELLVEPKAFGRFIIKSAVK